MLHQRKYLTRREYCARILMYVGIAGVLMYFIFLVTSSSLLLETSGITTTHTKVRAKSTKEPVKWSGDPDEYPVGWVKLPTIPKGKQTEDDGKLHIIFSTGCNLYQHWQSELLLATAALVGQRGRITRIVSGCQTNAEKVDGVHRMRAHPEGKNEQLTPMTDLLRSVNDDFGLFITPSFPGADQFPWINKPSSIKYFFDCSKDELDRYGETVVAVLDPDFIFLRPLSQTGSLMDDVIATRGHDSDAGRNKEFIDVAKPGRPVAQRYYLGGGWVSSRYNLETILGRKDPKVEQWTREEASMYTDVGPPMILAVSDWIKLAPKWEHNMLPVLKSSKEPDILSDMWAYSIAAAELDLKHTILDHFMISSPGDADEAYPWVEHWKTMTCKNPDNKVPGQKIPVFLHMAATFTAKHPQSKGEWLFHKGHIPPNIFDCEMPLIIEPPDDTFAIAEEGAKHRQAWALCQATASLNNALLAFKKKYCPVGFEKRKLIRLVRNKIEDPHCDVKTSKWCFPLAEIQGLPSSWRSYLFSS